MINDAQKLCNPVDKNDEFGEIPPIEHLKCYTITDPQTITDQPQFTDQFHLSLETLNMIDEEEFCSAADKHILQLIGGSLIPIDSTSFLLAGAQITASWMIPVVVAGIGIGFVVLRKFKN